MLQQPRQRKPLPPPQRRAFVVDSTQSTASAPKLPTASGCGNDINRGQLAETGTTRNGANQSHANQTGSSGPGE